MMNIMYFVYINWDKQKEREGKCVLSNIRTAYVAIISSNLHEYLTSILHNLIQQLLWNTWILFLRFQSIYRILCFTMHRKQWEQYVKCETIEIDPYFHIGLNIKLWYPCNSTALSVLQFSRLINILSEIFWSYVLIN